MFEAKIGCGDITNETISWILEREEELSKVEIIEMLSLAQYLEYKFLFEIE